MSQIKNKEAFIDEIKDAAAMYCYDNKDKDFNVVVHVSASDGWVTAEIQEEVSHD